MKKYIFGDRNGIYIIDLQKTLRCFKKGVAFVTESIGNGETLLFVGTKRQAREVVEREANRCGAFYVTHRWLGGMLTNFKTIRKSVDHLKKLDTMKIWNSNVLPYPSFGLQLFDILRLILINIKKSLNIVPSMII